MKRLMTKICEFGILISNYKPEALEVGNIKSHGNKLSNWNTDFN